MGKCHLSLPPNGATIEDIQTTDGTHTNEDNEEQLAMVTVMGVQQLERLYACVKCKKTMQPTASKIAECNNCQMTQKLSTPKLTAKLLRMKAINNA